MNEAINAMNPDVLGALVILFGAISVAGMVYMMIEMGEKL